MTINLYPSVLLDGAVSSDTAGNGSNDDVCQQIHDACKGFGTNEDALVAVLGKLTPEQRCYVHIRYEQMFEKNLSEVLKSELNERRAFGKTLHYLSLNPCMADCAVIHDACNGKTSNADKFLLCTILCGRSNQEMDLLKKTYFDMYTKDLGAELTRELGGDLEQLALNTLQAMEEEYDDGKHDDDKMKSDMKALNKMGEGNWKGTDEKGMFKIIVKSPPEYLKKMDMSYAEEYGNTLHKALENELTGIVQDVAMYLFGSKTNPKKEAAKLIQKACSGVGTNEDLLNVSLLRFGSIMSDVKLEYVDLYGKTIADSIRQETRGDSEKLLLYMIGEAE